MLKRMSVALLAGASSLGISLPQAAAIEATPLSEPTVVFADQPPQPVRTVYAERSAMGGGFIEFLFGDGPPQGGRYQQQPAYQGQPSYDPRRPLLPMDPQQTMRQHWPTGKTSASASPSSTSGTPSSTRFALYRPR